MAFTIQGVTQQVTRLLAHFIHMNSRGKDFVIFLIQAPSNANERRMKSLFLVINWVLIGDKQRVNKPLLQTHRYIVEKYTQRQPSNFIKCLFASRLNPSTLCCSTCRALHSLGPLVVLKSISLIIGATRRCKARVMWWFCLCNELESYHLEAALAWLPVKQRLRCNQWTMRLAMKGKNKKEEEKFQNFCFLWEIGMWMLRCWQCYL